MATKYCFVVSCTNNSKKNPEKEFFYVPKNASKRKMWCDSVGRKVESIGINSTSYCCIDHFNVDHDFEEVDDPSSSGKRKLKPNIIPCLKHLDNLSNSIASFTSFASKSSDSESEDVSTSQLQASEGSQDLDVKSNEMSDCHSSDYTTVKSEIVIEGEVDYSVPEEVIELAKKKTKVLLKTELVKEFFGIELTKMFLVDVICNETGIRKSHLLMCLQKIKQNLSFAVLAFDYALGPSHCRQIFTQTVCVLAKALGKFVAWSDNKVVERRLPIDTSANFKDVSSIIHCFEIQKQNPSNAVHQSHTWSQYEQCNTIKYLVSSTPDGVINFISKGFGGRISDLEIVQCSGYLDTLPPNSVVMADRGFMSIRPLLATKGCRLLRPASVCGTEEINVHNVHLMRVHIEEVVRRYEEFGILLPYATVNTYLIASMDEIVQVVSALINIRSALL